jgi:hypothetical protein
MKSKSILVGAIVILLITTELQAMIFHDGGIHEVSGRVQDSIEVYDGLNDQATVLNVKVYAEDTEIWEGVDIYGHSQINVNPDMSSGRIYIGHGIFSYNYSHIAVYGGEITPAGDFSAIYTADYSTATITGGNIKGTVMAINNSKIDISGGVIHGGIHPGFLRAEENGEIVLSGAEGTFGAELHSWNAGKIIIHGSNFNYPIGPITDLSGTLTGTLLDGSVINSTFYRITGNTPTGSIILIPEPATLLLLGLGTVFLIRKQQ